jgi:hypothetical protein
MLTGLAGICPPRGPAGAAQDGAGWLRAILATAAVAVIAGIVLLRVRLDPQLTGRNPVPVSIALWTAFAAGAWLVRGTRRRLAVPVILLGGIAIQLAALSAPPRSSDDLYRYIWDGRVQAAGIDPYRYVPAASQLASLRDPFLWPADGLYCITAARPLASSGPDGGAAALSPGCTRINRPTVPTIYPPVAEAYFAGVYELTPPGSGSVPIQAGAALFAIATSILLLSGLRSLRRDPRLAVLWAWCPVVALEAGNNAHVDVVAAFLAAAALLALARPGRRRTLAGGVLLGLAVATKITPVLVVPSVLRRRPVTVAAVAASTTAAVYLPHLLAVGSRVIGFLPGFLAQDGYDSGNGFRLLSLVVPAAWARLAAVAVLTAVALAVLRRADPGQPWRGAVVMTGAALAVTTPWYGWYSLLLVVLVAMDGRAEWLALAAATYFQHGRIGYGGALVIVVAVSLIRSGRQRAAARASGQAAVIRPAREPEPAISEPAARLP